MAGPPSAAFSEIRFLFSGSSIPTGGAQCAFGAGAVSVATDVLDAAEAFWEGMQDYTVTGITLDSIDLKVGPEATGPTISRPIGQAGTTGSNGVSPNTALLIRKAVGGVSGRFAGRVFWPGMPESELFENGSWSTALLTGIGTVCDAFYTALETETSGAYIFPASLSDPRHVTALEPQARAATQRRRLRR